MEEENQHTNNGIPEAMTEQVLAEQRLQRGTQSNQYRVVRGLKVFFDTAGELCSYFMVLLVLFKNMIVDTVRELIKILENGFSQNIQSVSLIQQDYVRWFRANGGAEYTGKSFQE